MGQQGRASLSPLTLPLALPEPRWREETRVPQGTAWAVAGGAEGTGRRGRERGRQPQASGSRSELPSAVGARAG